MSSVPSFAAASFFFFATASYMRFNQMYQHLNSKTEELGNVILRNGRKLQNLILKIKSLRSYFPFNMLYNRISYMYNMIKKEVLYKALCVYLS